MAHLLSQASAPLTNALRMSSSRAALYSHAKTGGWAQEAPRLHNPYRDDPLLDRTLRRILPHTDYHRVASELDRLGERVCKELHSMGRRAELNEPRLVQQNAWGERVDELRVCPEWKHMKKIAAEEGVIATGYDASVDAQTRRVHQIAKLLLFSPASGLVSCPMAMTDGAAKTLQSLGLVGKDPQATEAYERLTSRDGEKAWTSGQWMTEKKGGSDVAGGCDTYAVPVAGDKYKLHGYKWFSSAVDADVALTLARVVDQGGEAEKGTRGLSLFLLRIRDDEGNLNGIQMVRLKDKLGTRQLPTAELLLDGCDARMIGEPGRGVASISHMLNITRIHNAVASLGACRTILSLARDYATRRSVFGKKQAEWPLHTTTLAKMEVTTRAMTLLLFEAARLLGVQEGGKASVDDLTLLRLITPVLKLWTAKECIPLVSEGIECFGGQGYMEDTGLPQILRDAQVTPIWEGTTNVLSLDVLRVFVSRENVLVTFADHIDSLLPKNPSNPRVAASAQSVRSAVQHLQATLLKIGDSALSGDMRVDAGARHIAISIGRIYSGALLTQLAGESDASDVDVEVAHRFCTEQRLADVDEAVFAKTRISLDQKIVFENFSAEGTTTPLSSKL